MKNKQSSSPNSSLAIGERKLISALILIALALLGMIALITYRPAHFYLISTSEQALTEKSWMGTWGTSFAFWNLRIFGLMAWSFPFYFLWIAFLLSFRFSHLLGLSRLIALFLNFFSGLILLSLAQKNFFSLFNLFWKNYFSCGLGGTLGQFLCFSLAPKLGVKGSIFVLLPIFCFSGFYVFSLYKNTFVALISFCKRIYQGTLLLAFGTLKFFKKCFTLILKTFSRREKELQEKQTQEDSFSYEISQKQFREKTGKSSFPENTITAITSSKSIPQIPVFSSESLEKSSVQSNASEENYTFPPIHLLEKASNEPIKEENHSVTAVALLEKLNEFGVEVNMEGIYSGPVVTRFDVTPAKGVRVEKILNLEKNIALGLKSASIRILAPVPGKGCVGIELPNRFPLPVFLRDILESKAWSESKAEIPIVLGKEATGKPIVADLTRMPHLLIAGSTGSGKTVCINSIIASLLYHSSPDNLQFIMVDPKIVEMKIYNDLPHMLIPVVTDPKKVPNALKWLIHEMERRYQLFSKIGARNITSFNQKIKTLVHSNSEAQESEATNRQKLSSSELKKLPYIVCIIDELADLMMVAPADIETSVARLAQLARASGIHLILATQRPSVNVITGVIKANLPSRIAFKVASKVDSRTILDSGGADQLIGRGDMLFLPPGSASLIRAQGVFVSDEAINRIVEFLQRNGPPQFAEDVQQQIEADGESDEDDPLGDLEDELIPQAIEILKTASRVSTSLLQRRLKIGYNRAARIMEYLQEKGYINPESNS